MNNKAIFGDYTPPLFQHFAQRDFPQLVVVDPVGNIADAIADIVPKELTEQTYYFTPDTLASFNVFEDVKDKYKLVQGLCAFFDAMFPAGDNTLTRRNGNYVLANALTILLDTPNVSFIRVLDFITDTTFRADCIKRCRNHIAVLNWEGIEEWDKQLRQNAFAEVQTKLGTLLLSPVVYEVLQEKCSHFFEHNSILIFNLSRARLGDTVSKLLGTLFITQAKRPVYINGFDFYASDYIASLFSQGGYTVALNHLSTLPPNVAQTVLGFDEKYVFRTTPEDAEKLVFGTKHTEAKNLVQMAEGQFEPAFKLDPPATTGRRKAVLNRSRACHTRKKRGGRDGAFS